MFDVTCLDSEGNIITRLTQWDTGQLLKIENTGLEIAPVFHFCNSNSKEALVVDATLTDGVISVKIPNALLQEGIPIFAYLYAYSSVESGKTLATIKIPVAPRPKPSDYKYIENIEFIPAVALEQSVAQELARLAADNEAFKADMNSNYETITTNLSNNYSSIINDLNSSYEAAIANLDEKYTESVDLLKNNFPDGSPKGTFSSDTDLTGKEAGVYYNTNDGWIYYWDGVVLSDGICEYLPTIDSWNSMGLLEHKGTLDFTNIRYSPTDEGGNFQWNTNCMNVLAEEYLNDLPDPSKSVAYVETTYENSSSYTIDVPDGRHIDSMDIYIGCNYSYRVEVYGEDGECLYTNDLSGSFSLNKSTFGGNVTEIKRIFISLQDEGELSLSGGMYLRFKDEDTRPKYMYWVKLNQYNNNADITILAILVDDGNSKTLDDGVYSGRTQTLYGMNGEVFRRQSEISAGEGRVYHWRDWEDLSLASRSYADTKAAQALNENKDYIDQRLVDERVVSDTRYLPKDILQGEILQTKFAVGGLPEKYQIHGNSVQEPHSITETVAAEGMADWSFSMPDKTVLEDLNITLSAVTITQTVSEMAAEVSIDIQNDSLAEISLTAICHGGVGYYTIQNADGDVVADGEELTELSITSIPDGANRIYFQTDAEGAYWTVTGTINYQNDVQCTLSADYEDETSPGILINCSAGDVLTDELLAENGYITSNIVSISIHNENNTEFLLDGTVKYKVSAPAPETPIEVQSVGNLVTDGEYAGKYKVENIITGKNLLTNLYGSQYVKNGAGNEYDVINNQVTIYGITYTLNPDGTILANGTATADSDMRIPCVKAIKADENYFLSGCPNGGSNTTYMLMGYTSVGASFYEYGSGVITYRPDALNYSSVWLRIKQGVTVDNLLFKPQVETGTAGTNYETPKSKRLVAYLDEPLRKVGSYADYIDWKRQKAVRNVEEIIIAGTENWRQITKWNGVFAMEKASNVYASIVPISNRFVGVGSGVSLDGNHGKFSISDLIYFCDTDVATLTEFKAKLSEWYQSGEPLIIYLVFKTPVEEDIVLSSMELYDGVNNVYTTTALQPSNMVLEYNQNPTDVINELRQAIVALQSAAE